MSIKKGVSFWKSIVSRFALFFTGLIIFAILLSGYLVFNNASGVILNYSQERLTFSNELSDQLFNSMIQEVTNDITVLASSPDLNVFLDSPIPKNKETLSDFFEVMISNKPGYFQLRLIGVENDGKEIIRFNKSGDSIEEVTNDELQKKGDRDYFKEATKIEKGEIYFSEINLNQEYGIISEPNIVTLRAASPVFDRNDVLKGIVIINVDLESLFASFDKLSEGDLKLYIIDDGGQYVYAPDRSLLFSTQLDTKHNFYDDFQTDLRLLFKDSTKDTSIPLNNDYLSKVDRLTYFNGKRSVFLVSVIKENLLTKSLESVRKNSLESLIIVIFLSIILSYLFTRLFSSRIINVTNLLMEYADTGKVNIPVEEGRSDEIGMLTSSFLIMRNKIDDQVQKLNQALLQEKEAKRQRDEFLQNMSHEIRTPLNSILGLIKLLKKEEVPKAQKPVINSLERSAKNLEGLVYDVLDHKKLVSGQLNLNFEPTNIYQLLKNICTDYQYDAINKGLKYTTDLDDNLSNSQFLTDPLRVSQIVTNLIVNAIKYTRKGEVKVNAKIEKNDFLFVTVKDTGIGISDEKLERINTGSNPQADIEGRYGSYGLGLSIVKQLIKLFGGSLDVKSEQEKGSEFTVKIPIKKSKSSSINRETLGRAIDLNLIKTGLRILHIEDDEATRTLFQYNLNDKIILKQITQIGDFEQIEYEFQPEVVISDLMIGEDRIDDLHKSRQGSNRQYLLIVCSAMESENIQTTFDYFLQKPFDFTELKAILIKHFPSQKLEKPNFTELYADYDNHKPNIKRVLNILKNEFMVYVQRMEDAYQKGDEDAWKAINHKMATHIKNLKLTGINEVLSNDVKELGKSEFNDLINRMKFFEASIISELVKLKHIDLPQ